MIALPTRTDTSGLPGLLATLDARGRGFERLCVWFLENDSEFRARFDRVWLWADWPGRWGPDRGIDLVARRHDGSLTAIQAKNYSSSHRVTKRDIDTFLTESSRAEITDRLLIGSTDRIARSASDVMVHQEKPVATCLLSRLLESDAAWPADMESLHPSRPEPAEPRPHQVIALDAIAAWASTGAERGQVVMACGTGKTLIGIWAAEQLGARDVLVLVPTIPLLRQTARAWAQQSQTPPAVMQICSDRAALEAEDMTRGDEASTLRTTSVDAIAEFLGSDQESKLVLCTYDSSPTLASAMERVPQARFDLAIADEAHRCAGLEPSSHRTFLNDEAIPCRRRLFFTATPTVYGTRDKKRSAQMNVRLASMDNHELFGPVVHHLSFASAIEQGLLCPYQVAVIPISDEEVHALIAQRRLVTTDGDEILEAASLATEIACARAMRRFGCRRVVAFHPSVRESKRFSSHFKQAVDILPQNDQPVGLVWSGHVDGAGMAYATRRETLRRFESDENDGEHRLLSNVRLLSEGVDVPGIDAIAFVDTRRGQAAVIQAVGRAVRPAPGKQVGTVILPVVVRTDESFTAALRRSEHRGIVDILGALRSHDPDIIRSLDALRYHGGPDEQRPSNTGRFTIAAPLEVGAEFAEAVDIALASALGLTESRVRRQTVSSRALRARPAPEAPPPSDDDLFEEGLFELQALARRQLLPGLPQGQRFPFAAWWLEAHRRWASDELELIDQRVIANAISWLSQDAAPVRRELASLTDAGVAEQISAQFRSGGIYANDAGLSILAGAGTDPDELLDDVSTLRSLLSHAATPQVTQVRRVRTALVLLAAATRTALAAARPESWAISSTRRATSAGFIHALETASFGTSLLPRSTATWLQEEWPEAHAIGVERARALVPLVECLRAYRFAGDDEAVYDEMVEQSSLQPDQQLDDLGWDIYLLVRARGGKGDEALAQARNGSYFDRTRVLRDLLIRSHWRPRITG